MNTITVNVTQEDIDAGLPCMPSRCPVALAVKRENDPYLVSVGCSTLSVMPQPLDRFTDYRLPLEAQEFIRNFDERGSGEPFTFTAELERPQS